MVVLRDLCQAMRCVAVMVAAALCLQANRAFANANDDAIRLEGDYIIGSVVPVTLPTTTSKCGKTDIGGLLKVEAILFARSDINKRAAALGLNGSMGINIHNACDNTYEAMLDLLGARAPPPGNNPDLFAVIGNLPYNVQGENSLMLLLSKGITHISCDSSFVTQNSYVTKSGKVFHVSPSDRTSIEAVADVIAKYKWSYVGAITDSSAEFLLTAFQNEAAKNDICVGVNYTIATDISDQKLTQFIKELNGVKNYSVIALFTSHSVTKRILEEASRQNVKSVTWVMGQRSWPNTAPISLPNKAAQGMFVVETHTSIPEFKDHLLSLSSGNQVIENQWLRQLAAPGALPTPGGNPGNATAAPLTPSPSPTSCNYKADPLCGIDKNNLDAIVKQMLDRIEEAACTLDAMATVARGLAARVKCRDSSYCPQERKLLFEYIQEIDFTNSLTEHQISFSPKGFLKHTKYRVYNYQQNYSRISTSEMTKLKAVDVGVWSQSPATPSTLTVDEDRIEWNGGGKGAPSSRCHEVCAKGKYRQLKKVRYGAECCWKCAQCPDMSYSNTTDALACDKCPEKHRPSLDQTHCIPYYEDYVHWEHPGALVILFLMVVGICFSLYICFVLFRHGDTPIMRKAKTAILELLPFVVILFLLPIALLSKPTEASCEGYRIFFLFALGIPLAVIISRSQYFDEKCYNPANGKALCFWTCCSPRSLVASFFIFLHIVVALVIANLIPATVDRLPTDDPFTVFLQCGYYSNWEFLVVLLYIMFMAVLVSIFSFSEVITEENNYEVKWISMAMFNWYACVFFYVVFTFGTEGKPKIIMLALMDLLFAVNVLVFFYLPKWYIVVFKPDKNRSDVSPWSAYMKNQEKVSERLSAPDDSPMMIKRGHGGTNEKPEAKGLISDTDI